jgi:hypothetical protein
VTRVNWLGVAVWASGLTCQLWAGHKPEAVLGTATLLLCLIGLVLVFWRPRR